MRISGVNGTNAQAGAGGAGMIGASDPYSKSLKQQIANAQKELQELSANKDIPVEEKMKKRQEIQQRINDLNNQLHQHEIEQRRERMQEKKSSMDEMSGGNKNASQAKNKQQGTGLSKASMQSMVAADVSMKQADAQGRVATDMKGRARVLASEIAQDKARGLDVTKKEEELSKIEDGIEDATASQIKTLGEAGKAMQESAKEDAEDQAVSEEGKTDSKENKAVSKEDFAGDGKAASVKATDEPDETERKGDDAKKEGKEVELPEGYVPVDVKL